MDTAPVAPGSIAPPFGRRFLERYAGRHALLEHEAKEIVRQTGLPVPRGIFIGRGEPVAPPPGVPYPLVAKVSAAGISSKSELRGVRTGLKDEEELRAAAADLMAISGAEGVLVEETAPSGVEVIAGGINDIQFGPVVMFGMGGVLVELLRDSSFALAPLSRADALWLIRQSRGRPLLEGYRGTPPVDREALLRILLAVSDIMATGMVEEVDLNPVALYPEGAMILDAKLLLRHSDTAAR
ncbi:MAG: acetate--CoA ligase family protein [Thermodesulfovibrionales bacterium]